MEPQQDVLKWFTSKSKNVKELMACNSEIIGRIEKPKSRLASLTRETKKRRTNWAHKYTEVKDNLEEEKQKVIKLKESVINMISIYAKSIGLRDEIHRDN